MSLDIRLLVLDVDGIMTDGKTLLHANAFWMAVVKEPLADVVARLATDHPSPIIARRRIGA